MNDWQKRSVRHVRIRIPKEGIPNTRDIMFIVMKVKFALPLFSRSLSPCIRNSIFCISIYKNNYFQHLQHLTAFNCQKESSHFVFHMQLEGDSTLPLQAQVSVKFKFRI